MNLEELTRNVLSRIYADFYGDRTREFHRDKTALTKAVMRFGYECNQRGWFLDEKAIASAIISVLESARKHKAKIEYLPAYLDAALTKSIGQRAEELSAAAKSIGNVVGRATAGVKVSEPPPSKTVETMSAIFKTIHKGRAKPIPKQSQPELWA